MISAVAFVPEAPLLVPALTGGSSPELDELRAACRAAIRDVAAPGRTLVLLGAGAANRAYPSDACGSLAAYGVPLDVTLGADGVAGTADLPPALTVGACLVRDALGPDTGAVGFAVDADDPDVDAAALPDGDIALVVLGDGSACRTLKAPGYLDERAEPFDARQARVLREGRPDLMRRERFDAGVADASGISTVTELKAAGAPAWDAAARLLEGPAWDADLRYDAAPFGVGYFVCVWNRR